MSVGKFCRGAAMKKAAAEVTFGFNFRHASIIQVWKHFFEGKGAELVVGWRHEEGFRRKVDKREGGRMCGHLSGRLQAQGTNLVGKRVEGRNPLNPLSRFEKTALFATR